MYLPNYINRHILSTLNPVHDNPQFYTETQEKHKNKIAKHET